MTTLLVIDDDKSQRLTVTHFLGTELSIEAEEAASGALGLARLNDRRLPPVDIVLLDLYMPQMNGHEVLKRIRASHPSLPVIMLTASDELEDAVTLMREGASDFINKPFNRERLRLSIEQNLTIRSLKAEVQQLKRSQKGFTRFDDIIGADTGLAPTIAIARKAARSDIPVLISGESGTGKELLARAIHCESTRADSPFIAINCGAIPEHLVESTLFGHEKGSFTGAIARELGRFREAEGGTLFLDEVGELKPDMQTKLLRVLQTREIDPVGAGRPVKINVRILSATHRDLAQDVAEGRFREDLYYRLHVLPAHMPPLRERKTDIPALARHVLTRFCAQEQKMLMQVSEAGIEWLKSQAWPGNVREFENLLHRAVVLKENGGLEPEDFIAMTQKAATRPQVEKGDSIRLTDDSGRVFTWDEIEALVIDWAVGRCGGQVSRAARLLQMGQSTLYKKISYKSVAS